MNDDLYGIQMPTLTNQLYILGSPMTTITFSPLPYIDLPTHTCTDLELRLEFEGPSFVNIDFANQYFAFETSSSSDVGTHKVKLIAVINDGYYEISTFNITVTYDVCTYATLSLPSGP